jgi:precorrin-6Y C5,15-methyltransferase (decarboxylating)
VPAALAAARFAVLTDPWNTPAAVAAALIGAGMEDAPACVLEHLGGAEERLTTERLSGIARREFSSLNVLVVDRDPARAARPEAAFGVSEEEYGSERGQITKAEVRAVTLAKLQPWTASLAWDVGAGSGSLAIELAGLMPAGRVYAVERDPVQLRVLQRNLARHPRPNICLVAGEAPATLEALPAPDITFVGGTGAELPAVLEAAGCALRPGGRLVANFARLESLATWQDFARRTGWEYELVQLSVARGAAIGGGTRLAPLGPVFICTLRRPAGQGARAT